MGSDRDFAASGRRLLELLDGGRKGLSFYPPDHPIVTDTFRSAELLLRDLFLGFSEITLALVDHEFYLNDCALRRASTAFVKLASQLQARGATSITFLPVATASDIRRLFVVLSSAADELAERGGVSKLLVEAGVTSLRVTRAAPFATPATEDRSESALSDESRARLSAAREGYGSAIGSMRQVFANVAEDGHVDYRTIKIATEALLDSVITNRAVWTHLLNVKHTDEYTYNHSVNVATLSLLLAARFGVRPDALSVLGEAALLHDIGKQKIQPGLLRKAGSLTEAEWIEMRSHPEKGAKLLLGVRDVSESAVMVTYEHHIRYDHRGYPPPREKRNLHLFSHIVSVADIYDALTSDRGYRRALLPDMAMRIILTQSGTAFHPLVVKHFVNLVGVYPVGTFVRLRTGELGLVQYNQNRDLLRPVVLVVYDGAGQPIPPTVRDLCSDPGDELPIECSIDPAELGLDTSTLS